MFFSSAGPAWIVSFQRVSHQVSIANSPTGTFALLQKYLPTKKQSLSQNLTK